MLGPGRLVLVVGPSGAGKDTLIDHARAMCADEPWIRFAKRLVTRPPNTFEDHGVLTRAEFEDGQAAGRFALAWRAHGLCYALPGEVADAVREGCTVVANVSRGVVGEARRTFAHVAVALVTAPPEILRARIAARGRDGDTAQRVTRAALKVPDAHVDAVIENVGAPSEAAALLLRLIRSGVGAKRAQ